MKIPGNFLKSALLILSFGFCLSGFANTFVVNNTGDQSDANQGDGICDDGTGNCTLRAAIEEANIFGGSDVIEFNIPGNGPHTLNPLGSGLPTITDQLRIDGTSQPGYSFGNPRIVIDGSSSNAGTNGLEVFADGCEIRGLVIGGFSEDNFADGGIGIRIIASSNNQIAENFLGIAADGSTLLPNFSGINLEATSSNNTIGGTSNNDRNIISGNNDTGILVLVSDANFVRGNFIGTDRSGSTAVANFVGIVLASADQNVIGGTSPDFRNLISGNILGAVDLINSNNTAIQGNYLGSNAAGTQAIPNDYGIFVQSLSTNNQIGGTTTGAANLISGNFSMGIDLQGDNNIVEGNLIGTQIDRTNGLANGPLGINILGGSNNRIGGMTDGAGNLIAFHNSEGLRMQSTGSVPSGNQISRNSFMNNMNLGIDLGFGDPATTGMTPNDNTAEDADTGPNNLQNNAVQSNVSFDLVNNQLNLDYFVFSDPSHSDYPLNIEFFMSDPSGSVSDYLFTDVFSEPEFSSGNAKSITINPPAGIIFTGQERVLNTVTDASGNTSEFSEISIVFAIPVLLKGRVEKDAVLLEWITQPNLEETYILERSTSTESFVPIAQLEAQKGIAATITYSYEDKQPASGKNLYRVKSIDQEGEFAFSDIIEIHYNPLVNIDLYPNPAITTSSLHLNTTLDEPLRISLRDIEGKLIKNWYVEAKTAGRKIPLNLEGISQGVYTINVRMANGLGRKFKLFVR